MTEPIRGRGDGRAKAGRAGPAIAGLALCAIPRMVQGFVTTRLDTGGRTHYEGADARPSRRHLRAMRPICIEG
jgi:hypothetical protein